MNARNKCCEPQLLFQSLVLDYYEILDERDEEKHTMDVNDRPTVLVIGATSSIGEFLVRELAAQPRSQNGRVLAAVRSEQKAESFRKQGIETVHLDLNQTETIASALQGVDRVFLVTGYTVDMLPQSKAVIDAAKKMGVQHIVHAGAWAPADTDLPHFGWHQYVESYIERSGIGYTHLQPNMFMQNLLGGNSLWESLGGSSKENGAIHFFLEDARIGWIAAEDIASVAAAVLREPAKHDGKAYVLSAEARSVPEIAEVLTEVLGKPFHSVPNSPDEFLAAVLKGGMEPTYAHCAHETLKRFGRGAIPGQADVYNNIEALTGKKAILWRDFAVKHRGEFLY